MRRRSASSIAANPILVGAVTLAVIVVAVFLAYNANNGLPFVPTFTLKVEVDNGARLVVGNEVREGGERVGQVTEITTVRRDVPGSRPDVIGAELTLKLDRSVTPLPADTRIIVRPKSTLGLKYVDLVRGSSRSDLQDGSVLRGVQDTNPPELDDFFAIFDEPTRENIRANLATYAGALVGRGDDLNRTFAALPGLLTDLVPVMQTLSDPDTNLRGFIQEIGDITRITAPVAQQLSDGFRYAADTFDALTRDPAAFDDLITESPPTLETAIRELPAQRPLLQALVDLAPASNGAAAELRRSAGPVRQALAAGTRVLPDTPELARNLDDTLQAAGDLGTSPLTNLTIDGLGSTVATLDPTLRYIGPHVTVCNYFNYFWTFLSDHLSERVPSGTLQRIEVKLAPGTLSTFGATSPTNGEAMGNQLQGDSPYLHSQPYGRAVGPTGAADCEQGQRGYPNKVAAGAPDGIDIAVDPRTPGLQGPTFEGLDQVPEGETFSAEPAGRAPQVNLRGEG